MTPEGWNIHSTSLMLFTVVTAHGYNSRSTKYVALCIKFHTCTGTEQRCTGRNLSGFLATIKQTGRKGKGERRICVKDMHFGCLLDHIAHWIVVCDCVTLNCDLLKEAEREPHCCDRWHLQSTL